jgi:hypothetical protein
VAVNDKKWSTSTILPAGWTGPSPQVIYKGGAYLSTFIVSTHATTGGVACIQNDGSENGLLRSYVTLANAVAICYDATNLYIGTSDAGIYSIALLDMEAVGVAGSDVSADMSLFLSTATAPAIVSNVIATRGLAWNDDLTRLCIANGVGDASKLSIYATLGPAVYDGNERANGPVVCKGNVCYWVYNGSVTGTINKYNDVTVPVADGWRVSAPGYQKWSDTFDDTTVDSCRFYSAVESNAPTSWSVAESGGKATITIVHSNNARLEEISFGRYPWIGVSDFSVVMILGTMTPGALDHASDHRQTDLIVNLYDATLATNHRLQIYCKKTSATETITAKLVRAGATIWETAVTQAWSAGCTLYLERTGTTFDISYDNGTGKTSINSNTHADNDNLNLLTNYMKFGQNEAGGTLTTTCSQQVNSWTLATPASYDTLWDTTINDIQFVANPESDSKDVLFVATSAGLYKVNTDDSGGWASVEDFTKETYGKTGGGLDHEVLHGTSQVVQSVAVDSDATTDTGHVFAGTDTGGVTVINLADDTQVGWYDSTGGEWGGEAVVQSTVTDSIKALTIENEPNYKFSYGCTSGGSITPDVDAPGDISSLVSWGNILDTLDTTWELATDVDVDGYHIERCDEDDDTAWNALLSDYSWGAPGTRLLIDNKSELAAIREIDMPAGRYKVRVRAVDEAGNLGSWVTTSWIYIGAPSALTLVLDSGNVRCTSRAITANVSGFSVDTSNTGPIANYGIYQVAFSEDGSTWDEWRLFTAGAANNYDVNLSASNGTKTIYVRARDMAGNVSSSYSANIILTENTGSLGYWASNIMIALDGTHFEGDAATITSSGETGVYVDDNVVQDDLGRTWRSQGAGAKWIKFDLGSTGSPQRIDAVAILNHNLGSALAGITTFKLQASNTNWPAGTPELDVSLLDYIGETRIIYPCSGQSYRYWRIYVEDGGWFAYLEIGRVILTSVFQPTYNFDDAYEYELDDPSKVEETSAGHRRGRIRTVKREYKLPWNKSVMTLADQDLLEGYYANCGVLRPVLVIPDPSTTQRACNTGIYGYLTAPAFKRFGTEDYASLTLNVTEIVA